MEIFLEANVNGLTAENRRKKAVYTYVSQRSMLAIDLSFHRKVLSGGRILALTSAQISDTGRYTCVAVNAAGEKQRDIDLRVYGEVL